MLEKNEFKSKGTVTGSLNVAGPELQELPKHRNTGVLAERAGHPGLLLQPLQGPDGWFIGSMCIASEFVCRESIDFFLTKEDAEDALQDGYWTQKQS